jgi:hypothetical protein
MSFGCPLCIGRTERMRPPERVHAVHKPQDLFDRWMGLFKTLAACKSSDQIRVQANLDGGASLPCVIFTTF